MKKGDIFFGFILIFVGIIFLLKTLGIINFSMAGIFTTYWPVLLILIGAAVLLRVRWFGIIFLLLLIAVVSSLMVDFHAVGPYREIVKEVPSDDSIKTFNLDIDYGAGKVNIGSRPNTLATLVVNTSDSKDPSFEYKKEEDTGTLTINRNPDVGFTFKSDGGFGYRGKDGWDIGIGTENEVNINLDYGAAEMKLDLTSLKVNELDIDSGASSTEIIFSTYPTKVSIDTGASSVKLNFPKDYGVRVKVDGGAVSTKLAGFTKKGDTYYNDAYGSNNDNIEIEINAGATSVEGVSG